MLGGSRPPPSRGGTCAWGVRSPLAAPPLWSYTLLTLCLHFAVGLTLRCWYHGDRTALPSVLRPGPGTSRVLVRSRTAPVPPCASHVGYGLCSARTDGADTHDPSRHAIELMHKPIPLCLRGARLTARDPLRLVVFAHHRLHTRRLQVLERLPRIMSLPLRTRPLDLPNVWRVHRRGGSRSEEAW